VKILLLGCHGQVGWELQRALAPLGELSALDLDTATVADFSQPESLPALVQSVRPTLIVNAAADTAVDRAEAEPTRVHTVNADAPGVLAREALRLGALLVHYSTECVFDGSGTQAHDEDAAPDPLSVYGRSKLAGEEAIRASGCRHLILRTSWVHSAHGDHFARTILRLAAERDELRVVDDQIGAPTGADLLADITAHAVRAVLAAPSLAGTYHCVAAGQTSWHGYARHVVAWAHRHGRPVRATPERVRAVSSADYPAAARRPLNGRLDTTRLRHRFGLVLPPWQAGVDRMLAEMHRRGPIGSGSA
jgi:dTDP-4-dehydrorhamnose reductase